MGTSRNKEQLATVKRRVTLKPSFKDSARWAPFDCQTYLTSAP